MDNSQLINNYIKLQKPMVEKITKKFSKVTNEDDDEYDDHYLYLQCRNEKNDKLPALQGWYMLAGHEFKNWQDKEGFEFDTGYKNTFNFVLFMNKNSKYMADWHTEFFFREYIPKTNRLLSEETESFYTLKESKDYSVSDFLLDCVSVGLQLSPTIHKKLYNEKLEFLDSEHKVLLEQSSLNQNISNVLSNGEQKISSEQCKDLIIEYFSTINVDVQIEKIKRTKKYKDNDKNVIREFNIGFGTAIITEKGADLTLTNYVDALDVVHNINYKKESTKSTDVTGKIDNPIASNVLKL